ncbi:WbqC family protein [Spiribacter roseus]|uniref:WbqC family protein n=1 Tax=Spiribacter roseus TaxID=1855875 RepID=UPI001330AA2B|nr:WbqC family protein [Spiribacter roseus]KAF0283212.1 hypothetical protein BA898_05135 [Spiribacter roseus]
MKLAIMQPYFLPYIGYFQLMASVDHFIVYDNVKYTKKGWINRNRMLMNGTDVVFSLPLSKASDYLNVVERELSADFDRTKLLNQFKGAYNRAPYFEETYPVLEQIVHHEDHNLFRYIHNSIVRLSKHLGIKTEIRISSEIAIDHELRGQDKVLAFCKAVGADTYINLPGGKALYDEPSFTESGLQLSFIQPKAVSYRQFSSGFVPHLSVIDVLMFNGREECARLLEKYDLD